jgi:hypothetical protein
LALAGFLLALVVGGTFASSIRPSQNPANKPSLLKKPIEDFRYDYAKRCRDDMPPGMKALQHWLQQNVRGESWGIYRCEKLSPHNFSLHSEDRAIDWHLDHNVAADRKAAQNLIRTLLDKDKHGDYAALARRMGIQGFIWNCHDWFSGMQGLGHYSYCYKDNGHRRHNLDPTQAHMNHIHIELNWPGAKHRTSFWRSKFGRRY